MNAVGGNTDISFLFQNINITKLGRNWIIVNEIIYFTGKNGILGDIHQENNNFMMYMYIFLENFPNYVDGFIKNSVML